MRAEAKAAPMTSRFQNNGPKPVNENVAFLVTQKQAMLKANITPPPSAAKMPVTSFDAMASP